MASKITDMEIDIVVPWVDSSDPEWQADKSKYASVNSYGDRPERFRERGLLKYFFRCIDKNMPWVRNVYFITRQNAPAWLDVSNPKLRVVKHEDFIPENALPCFNSSLLERYLHLIPGLSEHFIYFNDDCYVLSPVSEGYFFKNGLPRDMLAFQPVVANPKDPGMSHLFLNDALVLSRHFEKRKVVIENKGKFFHIGYPAFYFIYNMLELCFPKFSGLYSVHSAAPMLKSNFEEVWAEEGKYLESLAGNRFRSDSDVNQYLFREWGKLKGRFVPSNITRHVMYSEISDDNSKVIKVIESGGKRFLAPAVKILCINDTVSSPDDEKVSKQLIDSFESVFGEASSYEKRPNV